MSEDTAGAAAPLAHPPSGQHDDTLSVPYLILAALLIGGGLFLISYWIATFSWIAFGGILLLAVGALMLFSPRAGANRSR